MLHSVDKLRFMEYNSNIRFNVGGQDLRSLLDNNTFYLMWCNKVD